MAIDTGPSKKFMEKTTLKIKKKLPGGGKMKLKKTTFKPMGKSAKPMGRKNFGAGSIRTSSNEGTKNPMPSRLNADIGFDY